MFLRNSGKKFILSRRQIFQSSKKRSKSSVKPVVCADADKTMRARMHRSEESWAASRNNLGNDSKNELQAFEKRGGNKVISDKEYDIKIYNEKHKNKREAVEGEKVYKSKSKITNKLSGSSIIIVYENGAQSRNVRSDIDLTECDIRQSSKSIKLSGLANYQKCSGDIRSQTNLASSSCSRKFGDDEINYSSREAPLASNQNKIVIQCSSKKDKNKYGDQGGRTRMKLIPPEELSEPKCLKIVKKGVNNNTNLIHDLSNMMTGGRLIKTLKSFLGDHNDKQTAQTSYVEIVQKLDNSDKKHKILIFKRQIEKCKKCKEEEMLNKTSDIKPESNIIRLTVRKAKNITAKQPADKYCVYKEPKNSNLKESLENKSIGNSNSCKSDDGKTLSLLKNSMSPDSNINPLLASTLNELAGTLNARDSLKSPYDRENTRGKSSASSSSDFTISGESAINTHSDKNELRQIQERVSQIRSIEISEDSFPQQSDLSAETRIAKNYFKPTEKNEISVICPPKNSNKSVEEDDSFLDGSEITQSKDSQNKYEDTVHSEEICLVSPDQSKIDGLELDSKSTYSSRDIKTLRKGMSMSGSAQNSSTVNTSKVTSLTSEVTTENDMESVNSNFEPVFESVVPNQVKIPSLENDTTFMQLFEAGGLQKMGKNDFLTESSMNTMKTEYYMLKKSYAAPAALSRLASVDSVQQMEALSQEENRVSSQSDFKRMKEDISITGSEDSVISASQIYRTLNKPDSYTKDNHDYLKLDFMNFNMNRQFDSFITRGIEQNVNVSKEAKEKAMVSIDNKKNKKKKGTLWHMKHNACKMMKSNHPHCRKVV